ncbi:lpcat1, partial [Symbiodinium natans]
VPPEGHSTAQSSEVPPESNSAAQSSEPPRTALDVAKSEGILRPLEAVPGFVAHAVGSLVGGASLGAGWAVGRAEEKLGRRQVTDSAAFKMGFRTWLYANGIWPTILCESGPYGNDFGPLPSDLETRQRMLRATPLIVSNHVSYLDTVVLPLVLEVPKIIAMAEVASWPLFGQLCQELEMIWVDRSSAESRRAAKEAIASHAAEWERGDRPLLIWPEGTTSNGQGIKDFKQGAFLPGVPVRPVLIKYTGDWDPSNVSFRDAQGTMKPAEAYGDRQWLEQFLGHMLHSCAVLICKPYTPSQEEKANPELFKANVHKLMSERLDELNQYTERQKQNKGTGVPKGLKEVGGALFGNVEAFLQTAQNRLSEKSEEVQTAFPWLQKLTARRRPNGYIA